MIFKWFVLAMFFCAVYSFSEFLWINTNNPLVGIVNGREIRANQFKKYGFEEGSPKKVREYFNAIAEKYALLDYARRNHTDVERLFSFFDKVREFAITKNEFNIKKQKLGLNGKFISLKLENKIKEEIYLDRFSRAREKYIKQIKGRSLIKFLLEKS